MKKLLLLLVCTLMSVAGMLAQNANRSGIFAELQGGTAFGQVLNYELYGHQSPQPRLKGGAVGSLDFGYRWAPSTHFAFGAKAGVWSDFAEFSSTMQIRIMPGIRWTSNDFGSKNMSAFIIFDTGAGILFGDYNNIVIPIELGAGLNFTQHFYGALVFNYSVIASNQYIESNKYIYDRQSSDSYRYHEIFTYPFSYPSLALRLGYRF